jgi:DNA-binding SARP family transcriptional activator/tetratricopeptide (TPR) repeat protein/DNA-binding XRE family transcriptional regulator
MAVDRWLSFGALLRGQRRRVGLSQRELAERAGLSVATVRDLEQGRTQHPQSSSLRALAAALRLDEEHAAALHDAAMAEEPPPAASEQGLVRLEVLGPLTLRRGPVEVGLGRGGRRAVLARLALSANTPVPVHELVDLLWGDQPPRHPHQLLQSYVSRLRLLLATSGAGRLGESVLSLGTGGYRLMLADHQLDLAEFRGLVCAARESEASHALGPLEHALRLWRDVPLADISQMRNHPLITALVQEYVAAGLRYADLAAQIGAHARSLPLLRSLAAAHPLHEPLHARLVTALAGAGLQADALAGYDTIRRRLADELGIDPGPGLTEAYRGVLRQEDPQPVPAGRSTPPTAPPATSPRALPRDLADFTGRGELIREWVASVPPADRVSTAPTIHAIDGMPGVGKTALAVHLAHLVADRYPDAQLFVDLQGHSEQAPLPPAAAMDVLLRQLGVPGERIPDGFDQRVAMWRAEMAGRRTLLVLDNAATAAQVTPLLLAEPGCLTLITSRRRLVELDGARTVSLGVLTGEEAVVLQRRIVGARVDGALEAAKDVARQCGHLALAIRLAAARLAHRPGWTVTDLSARLSRAETPLRVLTLPGRSVEAAFALSYQDLGEQARRLFRLLGLHPGPDVDVRAAAALADLDIAGADEVLAELVDTHLIEEPSAGRYRLHDLIRDYAAGLAADEPERDAAIDRLLTYYLHATAVCDRWLPSTVNRLLPDDGRPPRQVAAPPDVSAAFGWLTIEHANITASVRLAATTGRHRMTWRLAQAAWRFLYRYGYLDEVTALCELAVTAAETAGEPDGEAAGHNDLAGLHFKRGHWDRARLHLDRAIVLRATLDQPLLYAVSLTNKAGLLQYVGDFPGALEAADEASRVVQALPPGASHTSIEIILGQIKGWMGDEAAAERHFQAILDDRTVPEFEYRRHEAICHLGELRLWRGRFADAADLLQSAVPSWVGAPPLTLSLSMAWLGSAYCGLGRLDDAVRWHSDAMALAERHNEVAGQCKIAAHYAIALHAAGDTSRALEHLRHALDVCDRLSVPIYEAHVTAAFADIYADTDPGRAAEFQARADALYTRLQVMPPASVLAGYRAAGKARTLNPGAC